MCLSSEDEIGLDEVATRAGVHYQTAYRWLRSGQLPAVKVGSTYVVTTSDLDAFLLRRRQPVKVASSCPSTERLDRQRRAMQDALLTGDETAVQKIVRTLITEGASVTQLIEDVLVPPLAEIGSRWRSGELSIYVEHRATPIVARILGEVSPNPRGRRRGRAMVAALAGDLHSLPTAMATASLREDNWHVDHLGADMPLSELEAFATDHVVDLAVISVTTENAGLLRETTATLRDRLGISTLIGHPTATLQDLRMQARQTIVERKQT